MSGINKYTEKERRAKRRQFQQNEIAKDLHSPKYRQRIIQPKRKGEVDYEYEDD